MTKTQVNIILCSVLTALALPVAEAAVGDQYEESVAQHGQPIGKMTKDGLTTYVFLCDGSTLREVYDQNNRCIESSCPEDYHPSADAETAVPAPLPAPELEPVQKKSLSWLWFLLLIPMTSTVLVAVFYKKIMKFFAPEPAAETAKGKTAKAPCMNEASQRLSKNQMCFLQALHTAVHEQYIITYQEPLDRILEDGDSDSSDQEMILKRTEPVLVDFVLHCVNDSSVSAVVLLHNEKSTDQHKTRRINYLRRILPKQGIRVILFPENYQYDAGQIREHIRKVMLKIITQRPAA